MTTDRPTTFISVIDKLTDDHPEWVAREGGKTLMSQTGLLQQLREAVFGGMENTGGGASFGSKPPIDTAATDLLEEITRQATEALASVSHMPTPYGHAEHYVRLWAGQTTPERMFTVTARQTINNPDVYLREFAHANPGKPLPPTVFDEAMQLTAMSLANRWVTRIEEFFNPPSGGEIQAPCPNCETRYVYRQKDGQHVQSAALNFIHDRDTKATIEARCSACGTSWAPDMFERLAVSIGGRTFAQVQVEWAERERAEEEKATRAAKARAKRDTP